MTCLWPLIESASVQLSGVLCWQWSYLACATFKTKLLALPSFIVAASKAGNLIRVLIALAVA